MRIQEQVKLNLREALLRKDEAMKSILRVLIGEFDRVDKEVSDEKAISIIRKMAINAKELNNAVEASILENYLPKEMNETVLKTVLMNYIANMSSPTIKDMGSVMSWLKEEYSGQYDGKIASNLVRELLNA